MEQVPSSATCIVVDPTPGAVTIGINRPEKRNALTVEMSRAMSTALREHQDSSVPVVFRSVVPGMFVAGTDVTELRSRSTAESLARLNSALFQSIHDHPAPTVAVVEGAALGGGCELALACDFRVSTTTAWWGLPEVLLGLVPSAGGLTRLVELVGWSAATELVLTGRRVRGSQALDMGLVHRAVDPASLDQTLADLLEDLSRASPLARRLAKEAMRVTGDRHRLVDAASQALCLAEQDTQERLQGLLDGRSPDEGSPPGDG